MRRKLALIAAGVLVASLTLVGLASGAQAAVPPATGDNAVITVKVGSDRIGVSGVSSLAGVTLGLFTTADATTPVPAFGTCVSDADGDCSFVVPGTQLNGPNRDVRYYVRQISAPAGYYTNSTLATGTTPTSQSYVFQTGTQLRAGSIYRSTVDFMVDTGTTNNAASGGIWQDSRINPILPEQCGLDVAIVADLSNSVGADLPSLKGAATTFVNALAGTPSSVALFTFGSASPAAGATNINRPALMPVSTPAGAAAVTGLINAWALPGGNDGGTNWDRAFAAVANAPQVYDAVVVITDGNPTFYGDPVQGPGNRTRFREVENGIFSANAIKAQGSRIVAIGVGAGIAGSPANLRAISGTTAASDYYQAADYTAAGNALRQVALGTCAGSLTVVKEVVPPGTPDGSTAGAQPAGGWTFGATATGGVTVAPASGTTAAGTGALNFALTFPGGVSTTSATVTETPQSGYTLHPIGGFNAACTRVDTGAAVPVTNVGNGFTVTAASDFPVSCVVYNLAPQPPATIVVSKFWNVDGTIFPDGAQPAELTASLQLNGSAAQWSTVQTGYTVGQTVPISETTSIAASSLCTISSSRLTSSNGAPVDLPLPYNATLVTEASSYAVTNTVTCPARLTLTKTVLNGPAIPSEWTLAATAPSGALAGPAGTSGVTAPVTPLVTYPLAESAGDPRYVQQAGENAIPIPGSTISWFCIQVNPTTGAVIQGFADGLNGGVTIPRGFAVTCEARNQTAALVLIKSVTNDNGGTATPSDWNLTADPGANPFGLTPQTVPGSALGSLLWVRPGQAYTLIESTGPTAYSLTSITCVTSTDPSPRALATITLQTGESGVCTFVNDDQPAQLTLVKTVTNDNGGTAAPTDWTLTAAGPTPISGATGSAAVTNAPVNAGTYTLSESGGPAGYTAGTWSCTAGTLTGSSLALPLGASATCTINNNDQPAQLTLVKTVTNDNGGTAAPTDWTLTAAGPTPISGATGSAAVTNAPVNAGTYTLSESGGPAGYTAGTWSCTAGTLTGSSLALPLGASATCTIDNADDPAMITLVKTVTNDNGGTAAPTAWTLTATGPVTVSGTSGSSPVTAVVVPAGSYVLAETGGPSGYAAGAWTCEGGTVDGSTVALAAGESVVCTINNDDVPALPPTGGSPALWLVVPALVGILAGAALLIAGLRRRSTGGVL